MIDHKNQDTTCRSGVSVQISQVRQSLRGMLGALGLSTWIVLRFAGLLCGQNSTLGGGLVFLFLGRDLSQDLALKRG